MGHESFSFKPAREHSVDDGEQEMAEAGQSPIEQVDFSMLLGEGFDNEYFMDKTRTFPYGQMYAGWNEFLNFEDDAELKDRSIEVGTIKRILDTLSGTSNSPLMFPVFIQGLQSYYKSEGIPDDHVTPERMQQFYYMMTSGGQEEAE